MTPPLLIALWLLLFGGVAEAAQLLAQVDNLRPVVGEVVGLHLTLVDGRSDRAPELDVPGHRAAYQGTRQSTVSVNGRVVRSFTWTWALTPTTPGELLIPPQRLVVDGEALTSAPLRLDVQPRDEVDGDSRLDAGLSAEEAWLGQVLVYTAELRTRLRVLDMRWTPPPLEGLVAEPSTPAASRERKAVIDGETWTIAEVAMPLVAVGAGRRELAPAVFTVEVPAREAAGRGGPMGLRSVINTRREVYTSRPAPLVVRELPAEGRSADWTGLVGRFELRSSLSADEVALGGSVTQELRLTGDGTLTGFVLPTPPRGAGFTVYQDDPDLETRVEGGAFKATGVWRRAIVPEREGTLALPPLTLQVFDPAEGRYVDLVAPGHALRVLPGEQGGAVSSYAEEGPGGPREVERLADDILPIHPRAGRGSQLFKPAPALALALAPWLAWLGLALRDRLATRARRPEPRAALRARLAATDADVGALEALLLDTLAWRLGRPAAGLGREVLAEALTPALTEPVLSVYDELVRARYGGAAGEGLRQRVVALVGRLLEDE